VRWKREMKKMPKEGRKEEKSKRIRWERVK
jgi:hypothetical protein